MKIIILLLFPLFSFAQNKGDNTIVITSDVSMHQIKTVLFKNGYAITTSDSLFISTSAKEVSKALMSMIVMVARVDSMTYIKAQCKSAVVLNLFGNMPENNFSLLAYTKIKSSKDWRAWAELDKIAKELSPNVTYLKQ